MSARGRKALVLRINRKLAPEGKVVVKVPSTNEASEEYDLLDSRLGTRCRISLNEFWDMARALGVLTIGITK